MKLDLLYEIDVPKPWDQPHPWGQRAAEQRAYREAVEQIRLADSTRLPHVVARRAPLPRGPLPLSRSGGVDRCAEPGDRADPARLRRHAAPARVHAPDARRREGGDRGHPLRRTRRVGYRSLDAHGADGVRCRPGEVARAGRRRHPLDRGDVGGRILRVGQRTPHVPPPHDHAQAGAGPAPSRMDGCHVGWQRRDRRSGRARSAVVLDHAAARADGPADRGIPGGDR